MQSVVYNGRFADTGCTKSIVVLQMFSASWRFWAKWRTPPSSSTAPGNNFQASVKIPVHNCQSAVRVPGYNFQAAVIQLSELEVKINLTSSTTKCPVSSYLSMECKCRAKKLKRILVLNQRAQSTTGHIIHILYLQVSTGLIREIQL